MLVTLFAGVLGTCFGFWIAKSLTSRLKRVSQAFHDWSCGDFSVSIRDSTDDKFGKLIRELNIIAEQLKNHLDHRQELSILEECNRLNRIILDNVKQQAFAASAQLGAAKAHLKHHPDQAVTHLIEAELLIDKLRQELTEISPEAQLYDC